MDNDKFLKQLCPVVKTLGHYYGLVEYFKSHKMVPSFLVHGNMKVVKEVIAEIRYCDIQGYTDGGDLETAIPLALKEEHYDRAMDLFVARQERTAEEDGIDFEMFMHWFFEGIEPWEDSKSLKRFMTLQGEEFYNKHPTVYETFCQILVYRLRRKFDNPKARKLLVDLVAQPALLTPIAFVKGFLHGYVHNTDRFNLIKYGWSEAIREGLKEEYEEGGELLWKVIMSKYPSDVSINYPLSDDVLAAVLKKFKTKGELEEEWSKENGKVLLEKFITLGILLKDLWNIVAGYAISWTDIEDTIMPTD